MSKPDPSSSNADGSARGDTVAEPPRPARSLDDSWALSGAMPVPEVAGVTDQPDGHGELPAPPMIPAATPSGPGSNQGAVASVVARAAALRALGAKTIQGFGPAPIQKKANAPSAASPASPAALHELAQRQAQAESFEAVTQATFDGGPASFEAETQAGYGDLEDPTRARMAAPPSEDYDSSAPVRYQEPVSAPAEAPLYLDEPPATLRVSTGTSDHSVPEIDPGVSGSLPSPEQVAAFLDQSDPGYGSESHHADGDEPYEGSDGAGDDSVDSSAPYGQESGNYGEGAEYGRGDSGFSEAGEAAGEPGQLGDSGVHDGAASMAAAPAAMASRRGYASESDARGEAEWFEPSGAQPRADHFGHTMPQDHSFTEPSRRSNRPPGPNRFIAPIAVFIAVSAVVFAGAYFFYYRGEAAAPPTVAVSGTSVGAASGTPDPSSASSAGGGEATKLAGAASSDGSAGSTGNPGTPGSTGAPAGAANGGSVGAGGTPTTAVAGLVDVRFDSAPAGAMVMLVDREHGITTPVGTTPVRAALDPKGSYDAIFTLEGHPTKMVSLSGGKEPRIFADLTGAAATPPGGEAGKVASNQTGAGAQTAVEDKSGKAAKTEGKTEGKTDKGKDRKRPRPGRTGSEREPEEEEEEEDGAVEAAAMGSLSISARPACEISINGKSTGKSTPLRELPLTAGIHKITFINKTLGVNETIAVRVTPGKETKVAQDYTGQGE